MSMDRWNPFRDFDNMRQAMDRWMDDRLPGRPDQTNTLSVALDLHETATGYELEASMPGIKPEDIDIQVDRDKVTLRGQSTATEEKNDRNYIYRERRSGSFYRVVRLPEAVDAEKVEATLDHGILRVQLPKLSQSSQRRIQVRSGANQPGPARVNTQDEIAATSGNEGGKPTLVKTGETNSMSDQQQAKPDSDMTNTAEGTTGYGGEKQGLDANQPDNMEATAYHEGGLQARGNEATSSSTSGMSDVRTHQSSGQGTTKLGGSPEGGEANQYNDQAQKPF